MKCCNIIMFNIQYQIYVGLQPIYIYNPSISCMHMRFGSPYNSPWLYVTLHVLPIIHTSNVYLRYTNNVLHCYNNIRMSCSGSSLIVVRGFFSIPHGCIFLRVIVALRSSRWEGILQLRRVMLLLFGNQAMYKNAYFCKMLSNSIQA